jgi:hypothetical protein
MFRVCITAFVLSSLTDKHISATSTDSQANSGGILTPLADLSVLEVQFLLSEWKLSLPFANGFLANEYDGEVLLALLDMPKTELADDMRPQFPNAVSPQWIKLANRVRQVVDEGGVNLVAMREEFDENMNDDETQEQRRKLLSEEFDGFSGLTITKDNALISMGSDGDVMLVRSDVSTLHVLADVVEFSAESVSFEASNGLIANGTDLVQEVKFLLSEAATAREDIRRMKEEMYYVMTKVNTTCSPADEDAYDCNDAILSFEGECLTDITTDTYAWTDRTYSFSEAPGDLLDTYHTYVQVEMDGSPPCSTEGGYYGELLEDAQVAICCANHGTYSSAGNQPYASSGTEDYSYAYGLDWTEHSGEFALGDHGGTPCTFSETFLEAGTHLICCSEGWATGVFLTTPEVVCN